MGTRMGGRTSWTAQLACWTLSVSDWESQHHFSGTGFQRLPTKSWSRMLETCILLFPFCVHPGLLSPEVIFFFYFSADSLCVCSLNYFKLHYFIVYFCFKFFYCACVCLCLCQCLWVSACMCVGQRTSTGISSFSTTWVLRIALRLPGLAALTLTCWAILPVRCLPLNPSVF